MPAVKLKAGGYLIPVELTEVGENWELEFRYNRALLDEIKSMEGARWNPNRRVWTVKRSARNKFSLAFLLGKPVFAPYDAPLVYVKPNRPEPCGHKMHPNGPCPECGCAFCLGKHQMVMLSHVMTRKRCILAGKPGTGKTLVAMEFMELTNERHDLPWYIAPDSGLQAVIADFRKHRLGVQPRLMTYDGLKKELATWKPGVPPPRRVIMDESSRVKGHKTQRSEAALYLSQNMENYWKGDEYLIEMSGTPDPNEPVDWWMQCEIARPGYLKEPSWYAERKRLAITVERQGMNGNYPHHVQWKDGGECVTCKEKRSVAEAQLEGIRQELESMHKLALEAGVQMSDEKKKEVEDLINVNKRGQMEQMLMKEFDSENCEYCKGTNHVPDEVGLLSKRLDGLVLKVEKPDLPAKIYRRIQCEVPPDLLRAAEMIAMTSENALDALNRLRQLSDGFLYDKETHEPKYAGGAKEKILRNLLDEYSDQGRVIIYAAYTASINRIKAVCEEEGWLVWKYDGKSLETWDGRDFQSAYKAFQDRKGFPPKIAYVAHPKKGAMALTLTAAVCAIFFSNDFEGESREQGEDRIHRIGMDLELGATIIDILNLGTDLLVLERLLTKRAMSGLTIAHVTSALKQAA
jgi:hypothetical protein